MTPGAPARAAPRTWKLAAASVLGIGCAVALGLALYTRPAVVPPQAASLPAATWPVAAEPSLFDGHVLVRQDGQAFDLQRLHGKTVLLNLAFTQCSTTCPVTTRQLVELQQRLTATAGHQVEFVTVSADPSSDSPESLRAYAQAHGADLSRWHWLTGDPARVHAFIESLTGRSGPAKPEEHLSSLLMIDAFGRRIGRFHGVEVDQPRLERELLRLDRGLGVQARNERLAQAPGTQ